MKKALIITYYWPPSGGAGVQRWLKFTKYLRDFGWEPVIYTVENPEMPETDASLMNEIPQGITILKTPIWEPYSVYKFFTGRGKSSKIAAGFLREKKKNPLLENISVWIRGNLFIPDARKFWIKPSVRFLKKYLAEHPVDVIISTGPPHTCHLIALGLKKSTGIPWLADFRDPWTGIDFYQDLRLSRYADKKHHRLELAVLTRANEIVAVTPSMATDFNFLHKRSYQVITNGFDSADFENDAKEPLTEKFTLTHLGSMVPARNPVQLWRCLEQMIEEGHPIREHLKIQLVGQVDHSIIQSIEDCNLIHYLEKTDYVSHDKAIRILQSSQLLLLVINQSANTKNILTGKLFEYMAARRPILCIGPVDGDAAKAIRTTSSGYCIEYENVSEIKSKIEDLFTLYLKKELQLPAGQINMYDRRNLTSELCKILESITRKKPNS